MEDLMKIDIYELFDLQVTAEEKEIRSSYRKKAKSCHPDKNPDNPKAAELFRQLTKALEILLDSKAKAAYDKLLRAKKAVALRNRELDSKRKKLKEDLESREKLAQEERVDQIDAAQKLKEEIERLRKEGSKQVEEEQKLLFQQIVEEKEKMKYSLNIETQDLPRLKVKWNAKKCDPDNGGYNQANLQSFLNKLGHVTCLLVSSKKLGSAIVEFSFTKVAESAFQGEIGLENNPLQFSWISGKPTVTPKSETDKQFVFLGNIPSNYQPPGATLSSNDYESIVLMKLRQAEERKRLIQQMMKDDDET